MHLSEPIESEVPESVLLTEFSDLIWYGDHCDYCDYGEQVCSSDREMAHQSPFCMLQSYPRFASHPIVCRRG